MHLAVLFMISLSFFFVPSAEARTKPSAKKRQVTHVSKKTEKKRAAHQRRAALVEELKKGPKMKEPVYFPDEVLLAEARGNMTPLEEAALPLVGTRYRFGGEGEKGIDCSAFVRKVYSLLNLPLPRTARQQFEAGKEIPPEQIRRGDLVFFQTYADYASHVGIYLGDDRMIHASSGGKKVMISKINTPYFRSRFLGARRISDAPDADGSVQEPGLAFPAKEGVLSDLRELTEAKYIQLP